jgi:hypothetical protein
VCVCVCVCVYVCMYVCLHEMLCLVFCVSVCSIVICLCKYAWMSVAGRHDAAPSVRAVLLQCVTGAACIFDGWAHVRVNSLLQQTAVSHQVCTLANALQLLRKCVDCLFFSNNVEVPAKQVGLSPLVICCLSRTVI